MSVPHPLIITLVFAPLIGALTVLVVATRERLANPPPFFDTAKHHKSFDLTKGRMVTLVINAMLALAFATLLMPERFNNLESVSLESISLLGGLTIALLGASATLGIDRFSIKTRSQTLQLFTLLIVQCGALGVVFVDLEKIPIFAMLSGLALITLSFHEKSRSPILPILVLRAASPVLAANLTLLTAIVPAPAEQWWFLLALAVAMIGFCLPTYQRLSANPNSPKKDHPTDPWMPGQLIWIAALFFRAMSYGPIPISQAMIFKIIGVVLTLWLVRAILRTSGLITNAVLIQQSSIAMLTTISAATLMTTDPLRAAMAWMLCLPSGMLLVGLCSNESQMPQKLLLPLLTILLSLQMWLLPPHWPILLTTETTIWVVVSLMIHLALAMSLSTRIAWLVCEKQNKARQSTDQLDLSITSRTTLKRGWRMLLPPNRNTLSTNLHTTWLTGLTVIQAMIAVAIFFRLLS